MAKLEEIMRTEFSDQFVKHMKEAMAVSFYKYGMVSLAYPHKVNAIDSLKIRLDKYKETGNTEYLVDAANFAMIEFMHPRHPNAFFAGTDDNGSPGRVDAKTKKLDKRDNEEIGTNPNSITAGFR